MSSIDYKLDPNEDDWRLERTARLADVWNNPWTGQVIPKGARVTVIAPNMQIGKNKTISIPLPNATALLLNSAAHAFESASKIRLGSGFDKSLHKEVSFSTDEEAFNYLERMIESIILAFTALEAFINESIPENFTYAKFNKRKKLEETLLKEDIERNINIDEKLSSVLPECLICASPKGKRQWEEYQKLKVTRDRIVHMKTKDRSVRVDDVDPLWRSLFITPAPHITVKTMIDHFAKHMENKPLWYDKFPYKRM